MWKLVVFRTTLALGLLALDRFTHIDELGFLAFLTGMKIYNSHGNRFIYLAPLFRTLEKLTLLTVEAVLILGVT